MIIGAGKLTIEQFTKAYYDINIDCNQVKFNDELEIMAEFSNPKIDLRDKTKTFCFCNSRLFSDYSGTVNYKLINGAKPCEIIAEKIIIYQGVSLGISMIVPIMNTMLIYVLRSNLKWDLNNI